MPATPEIVLELGRRLRGLDVVTALWVGGSVAAGDYRPGVSDLDLVALVDGPVGADLRAALVTTHRELDLGAGAGLDLGCLYVDRARLLEPGVRHPTWTHGSLVERAVSGIVRAELVRHGYPVLGPAPRDLLPAVSDDGIRRAARTERRDYWARAVRSPLMWLDPAFADLGPSAMARGRHAMATGELLTKTEAIERADSSAWSVDDLRAGRRGEKVTSPRLRTALIAWRDTRRRVGAARVR